MTPSASSSVDPAGLLDELSYDFDGVFAPDEVADAIDQARQALEPGATVSTFLPVLIKRYARELLVASAQADGLVAKPVPELLFVCVHNAGRSQLAAALAAHLAPGKVHVRSAGSRPSGELNPVVVEALAERGIELTEAYPKPLAETVVHAADVIITMGCGDECPYFPGKRYEDWDVADPDGASLESVRDIRDDIQARITVLLRDLDL
ncbi:three-helix bundle dimerization domain-containing protein [Aeromicrobium sp. CTD01-1L150]|uniref:arsenate reductase/protein-tyrosine-phosphatase family protein n=1 Tax=Aeromicrobium sp. CTD01-1L150 TaxID=3341830 RepID=UPI0035BFA79B